MDVVDVVSNWELGSKSVSSVVGAFCIAGRRGGGGGGRGREGCGESISSVSPVQLQFLFCFLEQRLSCSRTCGSRPGGTRWLLLAGRGRGPRPGSLPSVCCSALGRTAGSGGPAPRNPVYSGNTADPRQSRRSYLEDKKINK